MTGNLTLDRACHVIRKLIHHASTDGGYPISVAFTDKHGFLLAFARMEDAPVRSVVLAQNKAYTASRMGVSTESFLQRLRNEQIEIGYFCDPWLTALPGGSPIISYGNRTVGAVGVSGRHPEDDQSLADLAVSLCLTGSEN